MVHLISPGSPLLVSPQYEVSGEEHLYSDFPEIDLSPLDASDFDSASCFSELQWCAEHSETESSQYSTDDSELLQVPCAAQLPGPMERPPSCTFTLGRIFPPGSPSPPLPQPTTTAL